MRGFLAKLKILVNGHEPGQALENYPKTDRMERAAGHAGGIGRPGGNRYSSPNPTPTTFRYTGQREAEAGLYYYGARFYDPRAGEVRVAGQHHPAAAGVTGVGSVCGDE